MSTVFATYSERLRESVIEVTPTYLMSNIFGTLRTTDYLANNILRDSGCCEKLAPMGIVLTPLTFIAIKVNAFYHASNQSFFDHCFHIFLLLDFLQFLIPICPKRYVKSGTFFKLILL